MSDPLAILAAGCLLLSSETELERTEDGWIEHSHLEVGALGRCTSLDLSLPPDATLGEHRARFRGSDGTRRRLRTDRWEVLPRDLSGVGGVRLHVPEARPGDEIHLTARRVRSGAAAYRWRPGVEDPAHLVVDRADRVSLFGEVEHTDTGYRVLSADAEVRVHHRDPADPPTPPATEAGTLSAAEAHARASTMALLPRGVDGLEPRIGAAALRRGAADDRGFARTVVGLAAEGPDRVEWGVFLPTQHAEGLLDVEEGEVAIWHGPDGPIPLLHPRAPQRGGLVWTPSGTWELPTPAPASAPEPAAPSSPEVARHLTLLIPAGDPQQRLWEGKGSRVQIAETLQFTEPAAWVVDVPPDASPPSWEGDLVERGGSARRRDDGVVVVAGGDLPQTLTVRWEQPDAPSFGEAEPGVSLTVEDPGGVVRWEGDRLWWLDSHGDEPVIPDRERLLEALDFRFRALSMPEPGLPLEIRSHRPGWELVELLRPTLLERAQWGELPVEPLWPRPLVKARRSGFVTSVEAALIVRLYAIQSRMRADWALVRPAELGPGGRVSPAGYSEGLVRVFWDDEARWIDPTCSVCGPHELRPWLEGASALGPGIEATPPPTPGRWQVEITHDPRTVTWSLEGPPALLLRLWLAELPDGERAEALATRIAGEDAELVSVQGVTEAGGPIRAIAIGSGGEDPLALPPARADGTRWVPWIGERVLVRPGYEDGLEAWRDQLRYRRESAQGRTTEVLTVLERLVPDQIARDIHEVRRSPPLPGRAEWESRPPISQGEAGPPLVEAAVAAGEGLLGEPYRWAGRQSPGHPGVDCLGLLYLAWGAATGTPWRDYPYDPHPLVHSGLLGDPVPGLDGVLRADLDPALLRRGDVLYLLMQEYELDDEPLWVTGDTRYWPWHTGLYLDEGARTVLHADPGGVVRKQALEELAFDALLVTRPRQ